jgi:hypothetical protein
MRSIAFLLVAIPVLAGLLPRGQGSKERRTNATGDGTAVEQQIKTLHAQGREAALKADSSFWEEYLADDYVGVGADGSLLTKDQSVEMLKSGAIRYEAIDERNVKVRVYGDTAVVSAVASLKLSVNKSPLTGNYRETFVWVKQEGNWKLASFQATRVAPRTPRPGNNLGRDARPAPP